MKMNRTALIFVIFLLSGCALLGRSSYERDILVTKGEVKKYMLTLKGKKPNMVHDEMQMFWPTYHSVLYRIHTDELSGVLTEESFEITYKNELKKLESYSGNLTFRGSHIIINLRDCSDPDNCVDTDFNGTYLLKKQHK
ncbi:hypothetical protein [Pseudoalteromonas rubra]|uniref:Lipoprotein n=1 Tax=Pseudoalteromonas rubra TaxID=43658 RepID=A0A5S3X7Q3_9GAMM|nr:hypothetical protein [Pseudoalteromonas rubra]TMP39866.1 hypothetical protein CWB98_00950 [Pseudoalteromonas rubra]